MSLLQYFEALEASPIGVFVKDKAATFACIEAVHLMALALLGAAVLSSDLRLLNVVLRDVPSNKVTQQAHRWFKVALVVLLVTGFFMLAGVATKCFHNPFYWATRSTSLVVSSLNACSRSASRCCARITRSSIRGRSSSSRWRR